MKPLANHRYQPYVLSCMDDIPQLGRLSDSRRLAMRALAHVLPFRTNSYVIDELVDWDDIPNDPIFQLTFPNPGMLKPAFGEPRFFFEDEQATEPPHVVAWE